MLILWGFTNFEGRGGGVTKSNIYRELPKKGGFDNLHGVWQKNGEEGVERIDFGSIFPAV